MSFNIKNAKKINVSKVVLSALAVMVLALPAWSQGRPAPMVPVASVQPDISDLVEAVGPSVVFIESIDKEPDQGSSRHRSPLEFFMRQNPHPRPQVGAGSGVIVDRRGYIVTNYHVIEGAEEIRVSLSDGRTFPGKIIGSDEAIDVAVVQIEADDFVYTKFADSDTVKPGQWAVAIGNPLGFRYTVTFGIISAVGRGAQIGLNEIEHYIQTDAAINRGNSGGPLLNMRGEIIGINTVISAAGQNLGFAVPANMVRASYEQLITDGKVKRGALGVSIGSLSPELMEYYGTNGGALISNVTKGFPAERAGIRSGDIITKFNGVEIRDHNHLIYLVSMQRPDEKVTVEVRRDKRTKVFELSLGDRGLMFARDDDSRHVERRDIEPDEQMGNLPHLGITLKPIDERLRRAFNLSSDREGYVITDVDPSSNAYSKGLRPGLVVAGINDHDLKKVPLDKIVEDLEKHEGVFLVKLEAENGATNFIGVRPSVQAKK